MDNTSRSWIGGLVLGGVVLTWTLVTAAVEVAGASVGPPTQGRQR